MIRDVEVCVMINVYDVNNDDDDIGDDNDDDG